MDTQGPRVARSAWRGGVAVELQAHRDGGGDSEAHAGGAQLQDIDAFLTSRVFRELLRQPFATVRPAETDYDVLYASTVSERPDEFGRTPHDSAGPIVRRGNAAPDLSDARQARPDADRPRLVLRGEMGRLPRPRLHRRRAEGAEPARLEHDRSAARTARAAAGLVLDGELVAFNKAGDPHFPLLSGAS